MQELKKVFVQPSYNVAVCNSHTLTIVTATTEIKTGIPKSTIKILRRLESGRCLQKIHQKPKGSFSSAIIVMFN